MNLNKYLKKISTPGLMAAIVLAGFLVYANILGNGFVWDDEEQILINPVIRNFGNIFGLFTGSTFNPGGATSLSGLYYRPLMTLSFMINYHLFGVKAFGFHLFQLIIHLGNSIFVFLIFHSLFSREKATKTHAKILAFLSSFLFAIHPAISEAVVYISATQDVLFVFFGFLSLWLVIRSFQKNNFSLFWAAPFTLFSSFLSKELAFVFAFLIFLYLVLFIHKKIFEWLGACCLIFGVYLFLRLKVASIPFGSHQIAPIVQAPLVTRLLNIPLEIFSYLRIFFFPHRLFICQHQLVTSPQDHRFWLYLLVEICLFSLIIFYWLKKKSKLFLFLFIWFCLGLGPILNIFPLDMTVAERWFYLPSIPLFGLTLFITHQVIAFRASLKRYRSYLILALLLLFATRTVRRTFDWRDGYTLYAHDVRANPEAFDLQNNFGVELFRQGEIDKALEHFKKSIELEPGWSISNNNLGATYQRMGDLQKASFYYQKALEYGDYYLAYENLAFLLLKVQGPQKAWQFTQKALTKLPQNAQLNATAALSLYQLGEKNEALKFAKVAYNLSPTEQNLTILQAIINNEKVKL